MFYIIFAKYAIREDYSRLSLIIARVGYLALQLESNFSEFAHHWPVPWRQQTTSPPLPTLTHTGTHLPDLCASGALFMSVMLEHTALFLLQRKKWRRSLSMLLRSFKS